MRKDLFKELGVKLEVVARDDGVVCVNVEGREATSCDFAAEMIQKVDERVTHGVKVAMKKFCEFKISQLFYEAVPETTYHIYSDDEDEPDEKEK